MTRDELDFLRESNNIEDEWDDKSLQDAILAWEHLKTHKVLTRKVVLETHAILMQSRDTIDKLDKGNFRKGPVWIGGHEAKPWYVIEELMAQWLGRVNKEADRYESIPVEKEHYARSAHIEYEAIHPFFDGNGRTGRMFYNWERLRLQLPINIIWEKEKYKYYKWFE